MEWHTADTTDGTATPARDENLDNGQRDNQLEQLDTYRFGWFDRDDAGADAHRGLNADVVEQLSAHKNEPAWMLDLRLRSLHLFNKKPLPAWGADLTELDFDTIKYYVPVDAVNDWTELPDDIRNTWERLGIPQTEQERLVGGVTAQYESTVVVHKIRDELTAQGVIFVDTDTAVQQHENLLREHFATVIPPGDNKFAALNTAVWSGGSFIYVPPDTHVDIPLSAYFRINTENMGQFERTLIVVDENSSVHYVEGCSAPLYSAQSLHSAVVEIIVKRNGHCRYTTIQNWSNNVYNLVTKRATCQTGATMEWVDANIGSRITMKYPGVWLLGERAHGEVQSLAIAAENQHQDTGAKMVHAAPDTTSTIVSKSVAHRGGRTSYRGLVHVHSAAERSTSSVTCDALLVDNDSRSDTYPYIDVRCNNTTMSHEATVAKLGEDQIFYLMSRGLSETEAKALIVRGFINPIARHLPMEYALELNRLIDIEMDGAVG